MLFRSRFRFLGHAEVGAEIARASLFWLRFPKEVVERARALLSAMAARREGALEEVLERLLALDPDRLTPLEALRFLHELKALALGLPLGSMKG